MSQQLWFLLLVTMALGGAAVYVMSALRTEAGRKRVFPLLRPLMRVINPRVVRAVERRQSAFRPRTPHRTPLWDHVSDAGGRRTKLRRCAHFVAVRTRDELVPQRPGSRSLRDYHRWRGTGVGPAGSSSHGRGPGHAHAGQDATVAGRGHRPLPVAEICARHREPSTPSHHCRRVVATSTRG